MPRSLLSLLFALAMLLSPGSSRVFAQDASPQAGTGTLIDVLVDRADLPGEEGFFIFGRNIASPGTRNTYFNPDEKGTIAIVVESGVLTYELDEPGRILRRANSADPLEDMSPAGTPFTLEAGDAIVFPSQRHVEANESDAPVTFLFLVALEPVPPPPPDPSDVGEVETVVLGRHEGPWMALPDGPVALSLQRTTVEPGAALPVVAGGMQATSQETGSPGDLLVGGDGAAFNLGEAPVDALVMTLVPTASAMSAASPESAAPAGAGGEVLVEDVATVTLVAETMPEEGASFDAWMNHFEPGDELEYPSYGSEVTIAADVLIGGDYGAQSEGRMQLQRGGQVEEITPGTEVMLAPGDAVVYVENSAAQKVRNPGDLPTDTVSFGVFPGSLAVTPGDWEQSGLAGQDVAVHVRNLTLPSGASQPYQPSLAEPSVYLVLSGDLELAVVSGDGASSPLATLHFLPGQVLPFHPLREGNGFVLRSAGSEPLRLVELTISPAEMAETAGSTPTA